MDLIIIILAIALIGALVYLVTTQIPMAEPFKIAIYIVCVVGLVFFLIKQFGGVVSNVMP
jgi:predicted membrane channel-forming protein YqfA (hemolysin III family)